ncbi:manganese transporter Smf1p [[Candida] railenensis]|uniref:Manganese transporter Smf1p n=1 Tax=[Candida] railenensis TaxID=45579 RepID=A0A9P0W0T7_9ASCO|nr:manganese transporter Smf1p [[Candida] railenensis]
MNPPHQRNNRRSSTSTTSTVEAQVPSTSSSLHSRYSISHSSTNISNSSTATPVTNESTSAAVTPFQKKVNRLKEIICKYSTFIGPGLMVSVAYMDPGNYATGITAGSSNKYSLLFFVLLSNIIAIFLQSLCVKLGSVTGFDLARCSREYLPRKLNYVLWFLAECAIIATDIAEVIGSAIALNILIRVPIPAGVVLTVVDVLFVLLAYRNDTSSAKFVRYFEYIVAVLVLGVCVCFAVELANIQTEGIKTVREIFRGFAPSKEMFEGSGLTIATSIIGSTVMIHSLFLGSGIVQPRLREYDVVNGYVKLDELHDDDETHSDDIHEVNGEKSEISESQIKVIQLEKEARFFYNSYKPSIYAIDYSLKYSIIELALTLFTVAIFVNAAILIVAGSTLYGTEEAVDADLYTIHSLLSSTLAPVVGTVFMLALLFSGQSAGIVCTIAGQIVSEGHINWTCKPWIRRLATRAISIIPCLIISLSIGRNGLNAALNISQVVISILLPPLTAPLIYFTCKKSIMRVELPEEEGDNEDGACVEEDGKRYKYMNNNWITTGFLVLIWLFISTLNVYAIVDLARNGY